MNNEFSNDSHSIADEAPTDLSQNCFVRESHYKGYQQLEYLLCQNNVIRASGLTAAKLMRERKTGISDAMFSQAVQKVSELIDCMDGIFDSDENLVAFDSIDEDCINISFGQSRDITLNLYFAEDDDEDAVNEAYLSFVVKGKLKIMNDSIPNIAEVIKDLIRF